MAGTSWIKIRPGAGYLTRPTAAPAHEAWTLLTNDVKVRVKRLHARCISEGLISGPFLMLSGYRSRRDNEYLRSIGRGASENSLHIKRKAIDIRNNAWSRSDWNRIKQIASEEGLVGQGTYSRANFIHLDTRSSAWSWGS